MLKKFLSKYILEVIPSIMATVVGAYIVTHYINNKPEADKPQAAMATPANPAKATNTPTSDKPAKTDDTAQADKAAADKAAKAEAAKVKAAADKAAAEKLASEKAEKAAADKLAAEKAQAEKAEKEAEARRARERTVAKATPAAQPVEANATADDKRDANDLARAAIERLRGADRQAEQPRDTARVIEASRPQERKVNSVVYTAPSAVQPLPPPVTVAPTPNQNEAIDAAPQASRSAEAQADDAARLTPPADIPPRQLRAERPSVAEDVVSAAKSMFQAVVPR